MKMFCKWCGASTQPSDRVCGRCGRNIPVLSDCGGFYDLVPEAPGRTPPRSEPKQAERTADPSSPVPRKRRKGIAPIVLWAIGGLLAASVLLQIITLVQLGELEDKIDKFSTYEAVSSGATEDTPTPSSNQAQDKK